MSDNPIIYSDTDLEQLEQRLEILPDVPLDPEVARKLVDTAIRARRALIDFGLGEPQELHQ